MAQYTEIDTDDRKGFFLLLEAVITCIGLVNYSLVLSVEEVLPLYSVLIFPAAFLMLMMTVYLHRTPRTLACATYVLAKTATYVFALYVMITINNSSVIARGVVIGLADICETVYVMMWLKEGRVRKSYDVIISPI